MLLTNSISNTKKFFQRTIQNVKSLFYNGNATSYQRLPKTPPCKPFSCIGFQKSNLSQSYKELDRFYINYTKHLDGKTEIVAAEKRSKEKIAPSSSTYPRVEVLKEDDEVEENIRDEKIMEQKDGEGEASNMLERRSLVAEKLKHLEMMDLSNFEHVLDIEEVLYYYAHLTCPVYIDIFEKFFIDMYSDLFNLQRPRMYR